VHELDTSDLDKWNEDVLDKSKSIYKDYLDRFDKNIEIDLNFKENQINNNESKEIHVYNKCEVCDRIFVNNFQWNCKNWCFICLMKISFKI
jgi:hypothetical protein